MTRDEQIQDALDGRHASVHADADEAAYRVVFAALGEDDGFDLPDNFAELMAARLMPEPVRASPFERYVLPVLMAAAFVIAMPFVVVTLGQALTGVAGPLAQNPGLRAIAVIALALILVSGADRLARRTGLAPV